jgi:hypothetical protein
LATPRLEWNQFHSNPGVANRHNTHAAVCAAPPEDEQVMLETCRDP